MNAEVVSAGALNVKEMNQSSITYNISTTAGAEDWTGSFEFVFHCSNTGQVYQPSSSGSIALGYHKICIYSTLRFSFSCSLELISFSDAHRCVKTHTHTSPWACCGDFKRPDTSRNCENLSSVEFLMCMKAQDTNTHKNRVISHGV